MTFFKNLTICSTYFSKNEGSWLYIINFQLIQFKFILKIVEILPHICRSRYQHNRLPPPRTDPMNSGCVLSIPNRMADTDACIWCDLWTACPVQFWMLASSATKNLYCACLTGCRTLLLVFGLMCEQHVLFKLDV